MSIVVCGRWKPDLIFKVFAICIIDVVISMRNQQFSESDDEDKEPAIKSLNYRLKKNSVKATKYWDIKNYFCIVIVMLCMKINRKNRDNAHY